MSTANKPSVPSLMEQITALKYYAEILECAVISLMDDAKKTDYILTFERRQNLHLKKELSVQGDPLICKRFTVFEREP